MEGLDVQALHRNREKKICRFETGYLLEGDLQTQLNLAIGGVGGGDGGEWGGTVNSEYKDCSASGDGVWARSVWSLRFMPQPTICAVWWP